VAKESRPVDVASAEVTVILTKLTSGDRQAASDLVPLVYQELHKIAARYMRRERIDHTLQTTALVHEAYLKLVEQRSVNWQSRAHFFGVAAQIMRRILVDHARKQMREKRNGGVRALPLMEGLVFTPDSRVNLVELDSALERLAAIDGRQAKIVELRFFGGLTVEEAAEVLGMSAKTVKRDWSMAKAWLHGELKQSYGDLPEKVGSG
jgi:RNA polymerase sigma factor (TIGR02999 family)